MVDLEKAAREAVDDMAEAGQKATKTVTDLKDRESKVKYVLAGFGVVVLILVILNFVY